MANPTPPSRATAAAAVAATQVLSAVAAVAAFQVLPDTWLQTARFGACAAAFYTVFAVVTAMWKRRPAAYAVYVGAVHSAAVALVIAPWSTAVDAVVFCISAFLGSMGAAAWSAKPGAQMLATPHTRNAVAVDRGAL